jgi:hypothetical protein
VVHLLLQGNSNKQIALALHISERTVEFHLKNIYAKLQVNSRVELILKLGKSTGVFIENPVESTVDVEKKDVHNGKQNDLFNHWAHSLKKIVLKIEKVFAMNREIHAVLSIITVLMGIVLIIGGITADKSGAVVIGLIVSAIAIRQWIANRRPPPASNKSP